MQGLTLMVLRKKAGVTQEELAARIGTSQASVSRLEGLRRVPPPLAVILREALKYRSRDEVRARGAVLGAVRQTAAILTAGADGTGEQRT